MKSYRPSVEWKEKKGRDILPYWASELLEMWKDAERSHKARKPSSQAVS